MKFNLEEYHKYDDSSFILDKCISKIVELYDVVDDIESNIFYKTLDKYGFFIKGTNSTVLNLKKILNENVDIYEDIIDVLLTHYIGINDGIYDTIEDDELDLEFDFELSEEDFIKQVKKSTNNIIYNESSFYFKTLKRHGIIKHNKDNNTHDIGFEMIEDDELRNRIEAMFINRCLNDIIDASENGDMILELEKISNLNKKSVVKYLLDKKIINMD